jgi:integrase
MAVRKRVWTTRKGEQKEAWVADYVDGAGKRHIQTFAQKKKADAYAAEVRVDVNAGTHVTLDSNLTVADAAAKWLNEVKANGRERGTLQHYEQHAKLHIVPRIGAVKLAKLTRAHIEAFRDGLLSGVGDRHKALSRPMARKVFTSLKSILKVEHRGHLADNVKISANGRDEADLEIAVDIPTPDEVHRLIAAAKTQRVAVLLKVAACTGLRASELRGLPWRAINFKTNELSVIQRADRYNNIGPPKTKGSRRTIPLGSQLAHALKVWRMACPKGELDLVFPSSAGVVQHHKNMLQLVEPVMKRAGVVTKAGKPKYGMHSFRHFFASWCINPKDRGGRELPAKLVQQWLGHSSISMTLDVYGHLFRDNTNRAEINASEEALLG